MGESQGGRPPPTRTNPFLPNRVSTGRRDNHGADLRHQVQPESDTQRIAVGIGQEGADGRIRLRALVEGVADPDLRPGGEPVARPDVKVEVSAKSSL